METFSKEFKKIFLLTFTKELVRASVKDDIIELQKIFEPEEKKLEVDVEEEQPEEEELEVEPEISIEEEKHLMVEEQKPVFEQSILSTGEIELPTQKKPITKKPIQRQIKKLETKTHLFIPELKLPPHLEYLKPIPMPGTSIDLFKLNPLVKDPAVRLFEVNPDERVIVTGTMGTKPTDIILSKEDIDNVINKFSEISRIPINEGIYRVVAGNLILSAVISEVVGSKFVIKKMAYHNPNIPKYIPPFSSQEKTY